MSLVLIVAAGVLLVMPGVVRRRTMVLAPAERARLGLLSLLTGMGSLGLALMICSAPVVFGLVGLHHLWFLGHRHFFPGGPVAGWTSLVLLGILVALGVSAVVSHLRSHHRLGLEATFAGRFSVGETLVRVLPTEDPLAFALPAHGGSVVLSRGVFDRLDEDQLRAVVRHELSHLSHHHGWYLLVADLVERVFGMIPAVSRSTSSVRLAIEQWADEDSILVPADRLALSTAMRLIIGLPPSPTVAAYGHEDNVVGRLQYLEVSHETPTLAPRVVAYLVTAMGLVGAVGSLLLWVI